MHLCFKFNFVYRSFHLSDYCMIVISIASHISSLNILKNSVGLLVGLLGGSVDLT